MSTPVTINTAAVQYGQGVTECHCSVTASTILGDVVTQQVVVLSSDVLPGDWTDEDLCQAVAHKLGVAESDVGVASDTGIRVKGLAPTEP